MSTGRPTIVGIHIMGDVIRRAELRRSGRYTRIETFEHRLPEDMPPDVPAGPVSTAPTLGEATRTIASLPTSDTMSRCWTFPDVDGAKIKQMVAHRLEADLPVPIDELAWGYRRGPKRASRLDEPSPGGSDTVDERAPVRDVFAQAARRALVDRHTALLAAASSPVDTLTTEAEAIGALWRHGLEPPSGDGAQVLILAAAGDWLVAVLRDEMVRSLRRIGVDERQPELACRECLQVIESQSPLRDVARVLWCGSAEQDAARDALAELLGVDVLPVQAADHLTDVKGKPIGVEQIASFGLAIGLGLASAFEADDMIRFVDRKEARTSPFQQRIERMLARPWRWSAAAAVLTIVAATVHVTAIGCETREMRDLLDGASKTGSSLEGLQPKIQAMQRLKTYRLDVQGIVTDLCRPIPDSIVISSIQLSRKRRFVIKGTAKDAKAIFTLADALRKSDRFGTVNPERTEPAQGGGFTISAELVGVSQLPSFSQRGAR